MRERERERWERASGGRRAAETTNTNRSLNRKHDLKETEAARFNWASSYCDVSATACVRFE